MEPDVLCIRSTVDAEPLWTFAPLDGSFTFPLSSTQTLRSIWLPVSGAIVTQWPFVGVALGWVEQATAS